MANASGFWSYVHADDQADQGRIAELARDVVAQFEMLSGESIDLFLDRDALEWGDEWRRKIDTSLASVAFFIPVLTPRYFLSAECRRELQFFARRATALGVSELVLPLLYMNVPALNDADSDDDLVGLVKGFQWEDWRELRFADRASGEYRRAVANLAERLVAANETAEDADVAQAAEALGGAANGDGNDEPGIIDRMGAAEEAIPQWTRTLEDFLAEIERIGELMTRGTAELQESDRRGKGFAGRLRAIRGIAGELVDPANRVLQLGNKFTTELHTVDEGIRAIIELAPAEVEGDPAARQEVCDFFDTIRELSRAASEGLGEGQEMARAIAPMERMSRDLRQPLRTLRQGLTLLVEGREVTDEWVNLIAASSINCNETGESG